MHDFIQITEGTLVRREAVVSIRPIGSNRVEVSLTNGMAFNISIGEDEVRALYKKLENSPNIV